MVKLTWFRETRLSLKATTAVLWMALVLGEFGAGVSGGVWESTKAAMVGWVE